MDKNEIIRDLQKIITNLEEIDCDLRQLTLEVEDKYLATGKIRNLSKFIRKLNEQNLYTKELEEFIANYIRYDNGDDE